MVLLSICAEATGTVSLKESSHIVHFSKNFSEGYRHNTDFDNTNYVLKSQFNKNKLPIELLTSYSERKFSANGFYGFTSYVDQYEETSSEFSWSFNGNQERKFYMETKNLLAQKSRFVFAN